MSVARHLGWLLALGAMFTCKGYAAAADDLDTWWNNRHLMRLRDAYIEQEIDFIESFSDATQGGHLSVPEWRCSVAENTFGAHNNAPLLNTRNSIRVRKLLAMRMAWQREVIHYYCIAAEISDAFDPEGHQRNRERFITQRWDWRPSHALAGPKVPCPVPSGATGLTDQWWRHNALQRLRTRAISTFMAQNTAIARVLEGTGEDVRAATISHLNGQSRGSGELTRTGVVTTDPMEHRHFMTSMELMRAFRKRSTCICNSTCPSRADGALKSLSMCLPRRTSLTCPSTGIQPRDMDDASFEHRTGKNPQL